MAKLTTLYGLHSFRDELHDLGCQVPACRSTKLYRDLEWMASLAIHLVRDRPVDEAAAYVSALAEQRSRVAGIKPYESDASIVERACGRERIQRILENQQRTTLLVAAYVLSSWMIPPVAPWFVMFLGRWRPPVGAAATISPPELIERVNNRQFSVRRILSLSGNHNAAVAT